MFQITNKLTALVNEIVVFISVTFDSQLEENFIYEWMLPLGACGFFFFFFFVHVYYLFFASMSYGFEEILEFIFWMELRPISFYRSFLVKQAIVKCKLFFQAKLNSIMPLVTLKLWISWTILRFANDHFQSYRCCKCW